MGKILCCIFLTSLFTTLKWILFLYTNLIFRPIIPVYFLNNLWVFAAQKLILSHFSSFFASLWLLTRLNQERRAINWNLANAFKVLGVRTQCGQGTVSHKLLLPGLIAIIIQWSILKKWTFLEASHHTECMYCYKITQSHIRFYEMFGCCFFGVLFGFLFVFQRQLPEKVKNSLYFCDHI